MFWSHSRRPPKSCSSLRHYRFQLSSVVVCGEWLLSVTMLCCLCHKVFVVLFVSQSFCSVVCVTKFCCVVCVTNFLLLFVSQSFCCVMCDKVLLCLWNFYILFYFKRWDIWGLRCRGREKGWSVKSGDEVWRGRENGWLCHGYNAISCNLYTSFYAKYKRPFFQGYSCISVPPSARFSKNRPLCITFAKTFVFPSSFKNVPSQQIFYTRPPSSSSLFKNAHV